MAGKNRLVIKKSKNDQKYVVVQGKNNEVIANTETYKSDAGVQKAIKALKKVVKNAEVIDRTKTLVKKTKNK